MTDFAREAAVSIANAYLAVAPPIIDLAGFLGAPGAGLVISDNVVNLLKKYQDDIIAGIRSVFDNALTPMLNAAVNEIAYLLGGRVDCNGLVLEDGFVFLANTERDELIRDRDYNESKPNTGCNEPHTRVTWWLHRDVVDQFAPLENLSVPGLIYALTPRIEHIPTDNSLNQDHITYDLLWYNHLGYKDGAGNGSDWQGPRIIGNDWEFRQVFPGLLGTLYAVDSSGGLNWYRNNGYSLGTKEWDRPKVIGSGWAIPLTNPTPNDFIGAFCETQMDSFDVRDIYIHLHSSGTPVPLNQVIYAVKADGTLWWYRHEQPLTGENAWANQGIGKKVGDGWVEGNLRVFSGGEGIIYLIKDDGTLHWYQHLGRESGEQEWRGGHSLNSTGWDVMLNVFSIGGGIIYAVDQDGTLWWYKHVDYKWGGFTFIDRKQVGTIWNGEGFSVAMNSVNLHAGFVR